jgi:hypothetical protein
MGWDGIEVDISRGGWVGLKRPPIYGTDAADEEPWVEAGLVEQMMAGELGNYLATGEGFNANSANGWRLVAFFRALRFEE